MTPGVTYLIILSLLRRENVVVGGVTAPDKQGVHVVVNCERYSDCYRVTSLSFCLCYVGKCSHWGCYFSRQARGACNCQLWGVAFLRDRKLWESHNFLLSHCDGPRIIYFLWQPVSSTLTSCTIFLERIQVFSFFQGLLFRLSHFLSRKYFKLTHHPYVRFQSHVVSIYEKCVNSRQLSRFVSSPLINLTIWQEQAAKATPKIKKPPPHCQTTNPESLPDQVYEESHLELLL